MQAGDRGSNILKLQELLTAWGYHLTIDGYFGPVTQAAVVQFQRTHTDAAGAPLTPDGIVGAQTWQALSSIKKGEHRAPPHPMLWVSLALMAIGGYFFLYR